MKLELTINYAINSQSNTAVNTPPTAVSASPPLIEREECEVGILSIDKLKTQVLERQILMYRYFLLYRDLKVLNLYRCLQKAQSRV